MKRRAINLKEKLSAFSDHWSPKIIAQMNEVQFKLVKFRGGFVWHSHPDTDETFFVLEGAMAVDFRDGRVELAEGELLVVPRGVEHKPSAPAECKVMIVEPAGTRNTGDAGGDRTAEEDVWI